MPDLKETMLMDIQWLLIQIYKELREPGSGDKLASEEPPEAASVEKGLNK